MSDTPLVDETIHLATTRSKNVTRPMGAHADRCLQLCGHMATAYLSERRNSHNPDGFIHITVHYKRESTRVYTLPKNAALYLIRRANAIRKEIEEHDKAQAEANARHKEERTALANAVAVHGLPAPDQWGNVVIPWMPPVDYSDGSSDPFTIKMFLRNGEVFTEVEVGGCRAIKVPAPVALRMLWELK